MGIITIVAHRSSPHSRQSLILFLEAMLNPSDSEVEVDPIKSWAETGASLQIAVCGLVA